MPDAHIKFLQSGHLWLELEGKVFVHGGFDPRVPLNRQSAQFLVWDRDLLDDAWKRSVAGSNAPYGGYKDIFVGHTTTQMYQSFEPVHFCNVWGLDTGAGWSGKLTIMDVDTKKYWQSDLSSDLYGGTQRKAGSHF